jgi:hypothetical protein
MPLAKIHVVKGRYDQARIAKVSGAIQAALINTLRVPPEVSVKSVQIESRFRSKYLSGRMILSEKSVTFRDHALAAPHHGGFKPGDREIHQG